MKTLEELKKELFEKLSEHKRIEAFFKDSLQGRVELDEDWIENALVHNILEGIWTDHPLGELIDSIYDDKENLEILRSKLTPRDDYNRKMQDVLAELNGYHNLRKYGFEGIQALHEDIERKTPDFSAERDGQQYLFEVKNLRSPIDLFNKLLDRYYSRKYFYPELYSEIHIAFEASTNWRDVRFDLPQPSQLCDDATNWVSKTFEAIESSVDAVAPKPRPLETMFRGERFRIKCDLEKRKGLGMMFGFKRGIKISDPFTRKNYLYPLAIRVTGRVGEALDQLIEFDSANTRKKYVLVNLQITGDLKMFLEEETLSIVRHVDDLVKTVSEDIFVKLLNSDVLP